MLEHARLAIALLYNTYYMISSIFNDKCAIFLIFIALMCASGFNNWCCRMVTSQNYPAKLLCFQPSLAQVVNHETRVAINLAPSLCSSEMPTCNDSEDTPWQKSLSAAFLPFSVHPAREEEAGRVQQPPGPGRGSCVFLQRFLRVERALLHSCAPTVILHPQRELRVLIMRQKITLT